MRCAGITAPGFRHGVKRTRHQADTAPAHPALGKRERLASQRLGARRHVVVTREVLDSDELLRDPRDGGTLEP